MRLYIADSYSLNSGDVGILLSTLDILDEKDAKVTVELSHPDALRASKDTALRGKELYPRVFDISRLERAKFKTIILGLIDSISFLVMAASSNLLNAKSLIFVRPSRRAQARRLLETDFLVSSGGGFLSSHYMYGFRLYMYALAILSRKPFIIFRQSVGPFNTKLSQILVPAFLRRASYIQLRETYSSSLLEGYQGFKNITVHPDVAFTLRAGRRNRRADVYGFCLKEAPSDSDYTSAVLALCRHILRQKDARIRLFSHTHRDDKYVKLVARKLDDSRVSAIEFTADARRLKELYSECELLISSRMHAIIFAASNGVPFIALSYEPKFVGLLKMVGNKHMLIDDKELNPDNLQSAFTYYQSHKQQVEAELAACLQGIQTEVRKGNEQFLEFMEQHA